MTVRKAVAAIVVGLILGTGCGLVVQALSATQAFVSFIQTADSIIGTGFVAEGSVYTAEHVAKAAQLEGIPVGPDLVRLGPSPVYGYRICRRALALGEELHLGLGPWPDAPTIKGLYNGPADVFGSMFVTEAVWGGLSGSPVLTADNEVVGAVSMRSNEPHWILFSPFDLKAVEK